MDINDPIVHKIKDRANEFIKAGIKPADALNKAVRALTGYFSYDEFCQHLYKNDKK